MKGKRSESLRTYGVPSCGKVIRYVSVLFFAEDLKKVLKSSGGVCSWKEDCMCEKDELCYFAIAELLGTSKGAVSRDILQLAMYFNDEDEEVISISYRRAEGKKPGAYVRLNLSPDEVIGNRVWDVYQQLLKKRPQKVSE